MTDCFGTKKFSHGTERNFCGTSHRQKRGRSNPFSLGWKKGEEGGQAGNIGFDEEKEEKIARTRPFKKTKDYTPARDVDSRGKIPRSRDHRLFSFRFR